MSIRRWKQHDRAPAIAAALRTAENAVVNLTGTTVRFSLRNTYTNALAVNRAVATITNAAAGEVAYTFNVGETHIPGAYDEEWEVTYADGRKRSFPVGERATLIIEPDVDQA